MTNQEAIEIVKNEKVCVERAINGCDRKCEKCDLLREDKEIQQGYDLAIEALEKQIPKKPEYEADGYDENGELVYDTAYCPICRHSFEYGINDWECDYCSNCGQALDWRDVK